MKRQERYSSWAMSTKQRVLFLHTSPHQGDLYTNTEELAWSSAFVQALESYETRGYGRGDLEGYTTP